MLSGLFGRSRIARLEAEIERLKAAQQAVGPDFLRAGIGSYPDLPGLQLPDAQSELYQRLSWVYIAVTITAQTAAGARFDVKRLQGERTEQIENHPFEELLRHPNPLQSRAEFLEAMFGFWKLTGNSYVWLNRTGPDKPPSEMWIIPPSSIEPVPDQRLYLKGYAYDPGNGRKIPLETWEICHLKRFHPRNAFVGLSPIEALATVAVGDMAMAKWNANFFDKEHAKPAGALAFADRINDSDWERLKRDIKEQHGGTERRMMLLRNAGQGGVNWLQFGVNQRDMEFLSARNFNKEEVYAAIAPGLSSMLAVNATEANSQTGKATFAEMTVWPLHQAVAEKFTNDILGAYGDGLIGEFEDVRTTDRAMELAEQQAAYKVLTIAEVRERYFNLAPLGDERDERLVEGNSSSAPPVPPVPQENAPVPDMPDTPDVDSAAEDGTVGDDPQEATRADLLKWQRKAYKRAKAGGGAACTFESLHIPQTLNAAIAGALEMVEGPQGVRALFDPLINAGQLLTWESYP